MSTVTATQVVRAARSARTGLRELVVLVTLYVTYSASRLFADDSLAPAAERAVDLLGLERGLGLAWERPLNRFFVEVDWLGLAASFQYATAHYVVTAVALVWLYRRGPAAYLPARRALLVATVAGLVLYLLLPMAPPRFTPEYIDVLHLHAETGWWGSEASAPKGLGGLTNQLAAFPSLHAGWALWVALAVRRTTGNQVLRGLAWAHALVTAVVVVGTGNHWVLDVVAGWAVVGVGFAVSSSTVASGVLRRAWQGGRGRRGGATTTDDHAGRAPSGLRAAGHGAAGHGAAGRGAAGHGTGRGAPGHAVADRWRAGDRAVNTRPGAAAAHHGSGTASLNGA